MAVAVSEDAAAILALQKLAYQSEARLYDDYSLPPLTQTLPEMQPSLLITSSSRPRGPAP